MKIKTLTTILRTLADELDVEGEIKSCISMETVPVHVTNYGEVEFAPYALQVTIVFPYPEGE